MTRILEGCLGIYRKLDTRAASWLLGNSYPWVEGWYHGHLPLLPFHAASSCHPCFSSHGLEMQSPSASWAPPPGGPSAQAAPASVGLPASHRAPQPQPGRTPTLGLGSRPSPCSAAPLLCPREGLDRPIMRARSCLPFPSLSLGPFSLQLYPTVGSFWNIPRRS